MAGQTGRHHAKSETVYDTVLLCPVKEEYGAGTFRQYSTPCSLPHQIIRANSLQNLTFGVLRKHLYVTLGVARCSVLFFFPVLSTTWKRAEPAGWSVVPETCQQYEGLNV